MSPLSTPGPPQLQQLKQPLPPTVGVSNHENTALISRNDGRKRQGRFEGESSRLDQFVPPKKRTRRLCPRSKRRSMPLASKCTPEPSTHNFKVSPRARSNRHLHLLVARASNHKNTSFRPVLPISTSNVIQCRHSVEKRRAGLVKRSHSPVAELSPLSTPFEAHCLPSRMISQKLRSLLTLPLDEDHMNRKCESKKMKMKRRSKSPLLSRKMGCRSRSNSPCSRRRTPLGDRASSGGEVALPSYKTNKSGVADVRIIGPTVRGISEAVRIIQSSSSGILSMPTETLYTLSCFVQFQRPSKSADGSTALLQNNGDDLLKSLNSFSSIQSTPSLRRYGGPYLLLHSPKQAGHFMSLSRPKTFIYKQPIPAPDAKQEIQTKLQDCAVPNTESTNKSQSHPFTAVTFSESMEVFNRLACVLWPGPVKIFAPVRMRAPKDFDAKEDERVTSKKSMPPNGSSPNNGDIPRGCDKVKTRNKETLRAPDAVPIFPTSALATHAALFGTNPEKNTTYYVGFRCPSHPLAHRVLAEAYVSKNAKPRKSQHERRNGTVRLQGAIFGTTSLGNRANRHPRTAMDVCTNIISNPHYKTEEEVEKRTVYVLNGEDKREIFHVPACQFSDTESISLVINSLERTVSIIRDGPYKSVSRRGIISKCASFGITVEGIKQAIHTCKTDKDVKLKSKIISSVMRRWKVLECASD